MSEFPSFSPEQDLTFFGAPPLLKGEDASKYQQLFETVSNSVAPADIFESTFVRTIVDLIWEANRYRSLIANTLAAAEQDALQRRLAPLLESYENTFPNGDDLFTSKSHALSRKYVLKQQAAVEEVDTLLASAGINIEVVKAEAFSLRLREIETLNRMIASAEVRMKTTLREIDRHRKGFGQQLRRAIEQLNDPTDTLSQDREVLKRAA
jgi:hypothetical protein